MMDNLVVEQDSSGNIKPSKRKSTEKIDGCVAVIMALDRALRNDGDTGVSIYEKQDMLFI